MDVMEQRLMHYLEKPRESEKMFDIDEIPLVSIHESQKKKVIVENVAPQTHRPIETADGLAVRPIDNSLLASLGPLIKSCKPVALTEADTEYVASCTKHIFANHIALQVFKAD